MDKLKNYGAPIIAVVLVIAWYFFIRPALNKADDDAAAEDPVEVDESEAEPASKPAAPAAE